MLTVRLAACAQEIIRDAASNNISLINIYEGLTAQGFPVVFPKFAALIILDREDGDPTHYDGQFEIVLGENRLLTGTMAVNFEDKLRTRQMINVAGMVVEAPGRLAFHFWTEGREVDIAYHVDIERAAEVPGPVVSTEQS
jgi:hypothetical protein